ncbi:hypothetical protein RchiOBHm_Chr3g0477271 [Rosa chinensis]|uniref:Uncharacterized protein n=1 Tax=Rosa chinensis TaxID=74649 RepID=A0A2P6RCU8_ROSCH|nr:hypothetical protein RchiOBHm_Chr3g0477271 [Rosa chinensis]
MPKAFDGLVEVPVTDEKVRKEKGLPCGCLNEPKPAPTSDVVWAWLRRRWRRTPYLRKARVAALHCPQ